MLSAKLLRQARGKLSQRQFAAVMGVPQSVVARYESGAVAPSLEKLKGLLEQAGFSILLEVKARPARTHRLHELRSLEYHRRVADKIRVEPEVLEQGKRRVEDWLSGRRPFAGAREYVLAWQNLLSQPRTEVLARLVADDEEGKELRQNSPFASILGPAVWNEIVRTVSEEDLVDLSR